MDRVSHLSSKYNTSFQILKIKYWISLERFEYEYFYGTNIWLEFEFSIFFWYCCKFSNGKTMTVSIRSLLTGTLNRLVSVLTFASGNCQTLRLSRNLCQCVRRRVTRFKYTGWSKKLHFRDVTITTIFKGQIFFTSFIKTPRYRFSWNFQLVSLRHFTHINNKRKYLKRRYKSE